MIVAGGTYREEITSEGLSEELGGSAFRAAVAIRAERLVTALEPSLEETVRSAAQIVGFELHNVGRDKAVGFTYLSSFLEPMIRGVGARLDASLIAQGDSVLAFGMIEAGDMQIKAKSLVYDPQSADDDILRTIGASSFERLAICANVEEVLALGGADSLESSALALMGQLGAEVVVVKAGARGCLVIDADRLEWVGARPTTTVRKLGSGDIFSAAFALLWTNGWDAVAAARRASRIAGWWCGGRASTIPDELFSDGTLDDGNELQNHGRSPLVYLAGPFFTVPERWMVDECRRFLLQAGARVFSPVHDVGIGGVEVAVKDLRGLEDADVVFALLDGWDAGTVFELGWAVHAGKPCVALLSNPDPIRSTMLVGSEVEIYDDVTSAMYRAIWAGLGAKREPSNAR